MSDRIKKMAEKVFEMDNLLMEIFGKFVVEKSQVVNLTYYELQLLLTIAEFKVCSLKDLGSRLAKKSSWLSEKVDILVNKSLVIRKNNNKDRRRIDIYLSPRGEQTCEDFFKIKKDFFYKLLISLGDDDSREKFMSATESLYELAYKLKNK